MTNFNWVPKEYHGIFSYQNGKLVAACSICGDNRQTAGKASVVREIDAGRGEKYLYCSACRYTKSAKPTKKDISSWPDGHKRCNICLVIKPFSDFHKHKDCLFGYNVICKECRVPRSKANYAARSFEQKMWERAKGRAKRNGREFQISIDDIIIPERCPILGVEFSLDPGSDYVPSLDRINSSGGYTPDNIIVMTKRANMLKNNMTREECELLLAFFQKGIDG